MKTAFTGKTNPFTGGPAKPHKQASYVDVSALKVGNDPLPERRVSSAMKYAELFASLKPGQCVICQPGDASKIAHALNVFLERRGLKNEVKSCRHYPSDNLGRVFLLEPAKRALKVAA